jgi:hypothetical protein
LANAAASNFTAWVLLILCYSGWDPVNVREYEKHAELMLSKNVFDYYASGANDMVTLRENRAAFNRYCTVNQHLV